MVASLLGGIFLPPRGPSPVFELGVGQVSATCQKAVCRQSFVHGALQTNLINEPQVHECTWQPIELIDAARKYSALLFAVLTVSHPLFEPPSVSALPRLYPRAGSPNITT